jgi:hypothetical protein
MAERNVGGPWTVVQSSGHVVNFNMTTVNSDGTFTGSGSEAASGTGVGSGRVAGDDFVFTIPWSNGATGRYQGRFGLDDMLAGTCFDVNKPTSSATWAAVNKTFPRP